MSDSALSISSAASLRSCPRLYFFSYEIGAQRVKRVEQDTRRVGSVFHLGLEDWWKHIGRGDAPWLRSTKDEALVKAMAAIDAGAVRHQADVYEHGLAVAMMIAYHARWSHLEFTLVGVEEKFRVPLVDPDGVRVHGWVFIGRKDARIRIDDEVKLVEHKTTSADISAGSSYWEKLRIDPQATGYIDAARLSGEPVSEILWDATRKPDIEPMRATPEADRKYTQGLGCKACGGGKGKRGAGVDASGAPCPACCFSVDAAPGDDPPPVPGWKEAPALYARQRLEDEKPIDYQQRVLAELAANPTAYLAHVPITRNARELADARADLVSVACEIDGMRKRSRSLADPRHGFPRNTNACFNYGRRCDFFEVCSGQASIDDQTLYTIRPRYNDPRK